VVVVPAVVAVALAEPAEANGAGTEASSGCAASAVAVRDHQAEASNELADRTEALNEKLKDETKEKD
jgi:hypothetical protein